MPKPLPRALLGLALLSTLTACQITPKRAATPAPETVAKPVADGADVVLHSIEVERAYTLEDPREEAFRAQIRAAALETCGPGTGYAMHAQRPFGDEVIGEDFLFRRYDITFACTG